MINLFHRYFRGRWERYYIKNHWHLVLDLSLIMVILILAASAFYLYFYRPALPGTGGLSRPVVDLNNPPLDIEFAAAPVAKDGEPVVMTAKLRNEGRNPVANISLELAMISGGSLDRLERVGNNTLVDISGRRAVISRIDAETSAEVGLRAVIARSDNKNREVAWQAKVSYLLNGQQFETTVSLPKLLYSAELFSDAAAYYTSPQGDQLGIGPVPPVVGIPTNYWIFWEVRGNADFSDVTLSARLPRGVELTGERSLLAGEFNFSPDTRQLIWKIPQLKNTDGTNRLSFEVQLVPAESQVGKIITLVEAGRYFGNDGLTGEDISGLLPALTTTLEHDRFNSGQGEVIPQ